ncbi:semaphorin-2A-like [Acanthaster planci]|uniref:Semaphorin-2A-like n=1 Tax=Acanthaster planci TaxID=133434 RepID=A0A8B7ZX50_ACAPL|nr:semaphorin-2A-like [Acanthaster planci]
MIPVRTSSQAYCVAILTALQLVVYFSNPLDAVRLDRNGDCWHTSPAGELGVEEDSVQTGLPAYRILNKIDGSIYIGSNETLTRLSIDDNNQLSESQITLQTMEPTLVVNCAAQNPTNKETVCWNFIRIAERTSSGQLLVCGTNAFSRRCYVCTSEPLSCDRITANSSNLVFVPQQIDVAASAAVINGGSAGMLYGGSRRDQDTTFNRYALNSDLNIANPITFQLDTVVVGMGFINEGTFVGRPFEYTHDDGREFVFFFYRENAVEYTSGEKVFSRIARVCKNDTGGITNTNKFITFIKARLECSVSESDIPFYYDNIQDVFWDANSTIAYAIFTSQEAGPPTSALCSYRMQDIMNLFDHGYFSKQPGGDVNRQWQEITEASGKDFPLPRPGLCNGTRTTDYPPLLFRPVPNNNTDAGATGSDANKTPLDLPNSQPPLYYVDGVRFTSLTVDLDFNCSVFFVGTSTGNIIKISKPGCNTTVLAVETELASDDPVTGLELLKNNSATFLVATKDRQPSITWPLSTTCLSAVTEQECNRRAPYCTFTGSNCTCSTNCVDDDPPTVPDQAQLTILPDNSSISSCWNGHVFLYCHLNDTDASVKWNDMDCNTQTNDSFIKLTCVENKSNLVELDITVHRKTEGTHNCTAEVGGQVLTKQVEIIARDDCITQDSLQERCDEFMTLKTQSETLHDQFNNNQGTCSVDIQDCNSCTSCP